MTPSRIWQLDFLRGLAVIGMVAYHAAFLLTYLWGWNLPVIAGPWRWLARASAVSFLVVVGCSLWLKFQSTKKEQSWFEQWRIFWPRAEKISVGALLITFFTVKFTNDPVLFGILHHIAVSSLLLSLILILIPHKRWWWIALSVIFWGSGLLLEQYRATFPWLLWIGLSPIGFHSLDYFPLLPWMGWSSLGVWLMRTLQAQTGWPDWTNWKAPRLAQPLFWSGRHAFLIYLLHIPILLVAFWLLHALVFVR